MLEKTVDPKTGSEFALWGTLKMRVILVLVRNQQLGIKALDDETLQIELEKPVPYINQLLALNTFTSK